MKIRTEQLTGRSATPICMNGVSFQSIGSALETTKNLLRELCMSMKLDCSFSLLPAAQPKGSNALFTIHGVSFGPWSETHEKALTDPFTEEAVFLLYSKGTTPDLRSFNTPTFSSDPYAWINAAGEDGKTMSLRFNPGHLDVELYFATSLEAMVKPVLNRAGIAATSASPTMERYRNRGGDSNVARYEIGPDYLKVEFGDGGLYLFDYTKPGRENVERMKKLAIAGEGLNSFINTNVRKNYSRKIR